MKFNAHLKTIMLLLVLPFALCGVAFAQEITGNLAGTVKDSAGAIVKGATVTVTDAQKNVVMRTAETNDEGDFSVPNLPAGLYSVSVEATNFKKTIQNDIKVDVGQRRTIDIVLEAGNISETVLVKADPVAVELATATASSLISGQQARELSLNNRNWVQLVALAPGVSSDLADQVYVGTTNPDGQANTINLSVNGARSSQNTFTVDGADITDRGSNITIQAYPSVDTIGEFKVLRSLFPAESGRSGGGQVNVVTRSGTDEFHGSAFEFIRNEAFNANNFLTNASNNPQFGRDENGKARRVPFRYNNFGWTLGGPVFYLRFGEGDSGDMFQKVPRTFFFIAQEFRRDRRFGAPATVTVPDANLRQGIFPVPVCIARRYLGERCVVGSPQFVLPAGTPIPADRRSPAAQAYVSSIYNQLPLPNAGGFNLNVAVPNEANFDQTIIKIDHAFSDNWTAYYRFQKDKIPTVDGNALFSSGSNLPGVSTTVTDSPGKTHTFNTTYVLSPKTVLEGRYTYGYGAILSHNVGLLALDRTQVPVTLPFVNTRDRIPTLTGNGFTGLTSFGPYDNFSYKHNFGGSVTSIYGNHTVKYGAVYSIYRKNENALAGNNEGLFNSFDPTVAPGVQNTTNNQNIQRWANFLVGNAQGFSQAHFDYTADLRQKAFEGFAQDEWKMRPNLTVYYGVRYSYFPSPYDKNGRLSTFVPELYDPSQAPQVTGEGNRVAGTGNWCNGLIVNSQNVTTGPPQFNCRPITSPYGKYVINVNKTDFAPRFGLAWDPTGSGKTSIRTGYGIYHEQVLVGTFLQDIGLNPPYQETATATNTNFDNPGGGIPTNLTVQGLRAVQSDFHTPYMQHWSLDFQHQLNSNTMFTVGYFGSKGTHLIGLTELNEVPPGVALNSKCAAGTQFIGQSPAPTLVTCQPAGYAFRNSTGADNNPNRLPGVAPFTDLLILDQLRPYKGYRSIAIVQPRYNSNYHGLQVSAQHNFANSSQVQLAYTWSKNLTDSPNDRTTSPQNSYDIRSEYQRATLDRRHVFNLNYIYEIPFLRNRNDFVGTAFGGWQASGIVTVYTGVPFSVTTSNFDPAGVGLINANPAARPNLLCDPNDNAPHQLQWVTNQCFQLNPPATGPLAVVPNTFGTTPRGVVNGPGTQRVDFTMSKNFRFTESVYLQLRAEMFNIFNHTNFRTISTNITATNFGVVTATRDPRTMQFGLKLNF
jgi:hypothetical protein